jgi:hypothetical protein
MSPDIFTSYVSRYQIMARTIQDVLLNQWQWMCAPCRLGINMMDDFLVRCRKRDAEPASGAAEKEQTREVPHESPSESLEQRAMGRLNSGQAPPREIYDVRNRGRIDWSRVPAWAQAVDPELFEGAHEG